MLRKASPLLLAAGLACAGCGGHRVRVSTGPGRPAVRGRIAFVAHGQIWSMDTRGAHRRQLTHFGARDLLPDETSLAWAPDGKRVAVAAAGGILVVRPPRRAVERIRVAGLASEIPGAVEAGAAWSPTRNELAVASDLVDRPGLEVVDLKSGKSRTVARASAFDRNGVRSLPSDPSWDPAGRVLVYCRGDSIYAVDVPTRRTTRLAENACFPSLSPDGRRIVFGREGQLVLMDSDGGHPHTIAGGNGVDYEDPSWSPDGSLILARRRQGRAIAVVTLRPDGSSISVVEDPAAESVRPVWQRGPR